MPLALNSLYASGLLFHIDKQSRITLLKRNTFGGQKFIVLLQKKTPCPPPPQTHTHTHTHIQRVFGSNPPFPLQIPGDSHVFIDYHNPLAPGVSSDPPWGGHGYHLKTANLKKGEPEHQQLFYAIVQE